MTTSIAEQWRQIPHELIPTLSRAKRWSSSSPDNSITLIDSKPYIGCLQYFQKAFSDPEVTKYLTISSDFSPEEYITYMAGGIEEIIGGSPFNALYHIYSPEYNQGPVGHISIKNIDWQTMSFHRGLVLLSEFHGQHLGSKASYLVLRHMQELGFRTAFTEVHPENNRSLRLVSKFFGKGELVKGESAEKDRIHFKLDLTAPLAHNPFIDLK